MTWSRYFGIVGEHEMNFSFIASTNFLSISLLLSGFSSFFFGGVMAAVFASGLCFLVCSLIFHLLSVFCSALRIHICSLFVICSWLPHLLSVFSSALCFLISSLISYLLSAYYYIFFFPSFSPCRTFVFFAPSSFLLPTTHSLRSSLLCSLLFLLLCFSLLCPLVCSLFCSLLNFLPSSLLCSLVHSVLRLTGHVQANFHVTSLRLLHLFLLLLLLLLPPLPPHHHHHHPIRIFPTIVFFPFFFMASVLMGSRILIVYICPSV